MKPFKPTKATKSIKPIKPFKSIKPIIHPESIKPIIPPSPSSDSDIPIKPFSPPSDSEMVIEMNNISKYLLDDIIKATSLISPVIEIMKKNVIFQKACHDFIDSYQQFKDILINIKKYNHLSKDDLYIIIIFYNNLRSLYYNIYENENSRKFRTKLYKYWANLARFTTLIGMFIVKNFIFISKMYKYKHYYHDLDADIYPKIDAVIDADIDEHLLYTLQLIPEKEKPIEINKVLLKEIKDIFFGQVSSLVNPDGNLFHYSIIRQFNDKVFNELYEIYKKIDENLPIIKTYIVDYFNAKLESINANIKIIIGNEFIDTNELEKNLQEFSNIANEKKLKDILSLLSLYNKINNNRNDLISLLTIFEKIKKEYYFSPEFIKEIDEIIENFKLILKEDKEIYIYELYILLKTKYKLIELYNEYKEKKFLDNKLEVFITPIDAYIDIYENYYFIYMSNLYDEPKIEPLLKHEINFEKIKKEQEERERAREARNIALAASRERARKEIEERRKELDMLKALAEEEEKKKEREVKAAIFSPIREETKNLGITNKFKKRILKKVV